jgi:hypothetical protein
MARNSDHKLRLRIADEAAKIIAEEDVADYQLAKQKACRRLGFSEKTALPRNTEVEQALVGRQNLFASTQHTEVLEHLRRTALSIMQFLDAFNPHLVGSVLKGTANHYSDIQLHLFHDNQKAVAIHLLNNEIPYQAIERRQSKEQPEGIPGFSFDWQDAPVEILVFPVDGLRVAPPSPIDGKPIRRASIQKVKALNPRDFYS